MAKKEGYEEMARLCAFFFEHAERGDDCVIPVRRGGIMGKQGGFSGQSTMALKDRGVLARDSGEMWMFDPDKLPATVFKIFDRLRTTSASDQSDGTPVLDDGDADGPDPLEVLAFEPPDVDEDPPPEEIIKEIAKEHPLEVGPLELEGLKARIRAIEGAAAFLKDLQEQLQDLRSAFEAFRDRPPRVSEMVGTAYVSSREANAELFQLIEKLRHRIAHIESSNQRAAKEAVGLESRVEKHETP